MSGMINSSVEPSAATAVRAESLDHVGVHTDTGAKGRSDSESGHSPLEKLIMKSNLNAFLHRRYGSRGTA